jgi:hypothetical protein
MPDTPHLRPATADEIADALSFALRYQGPKPTVAVHAEAIKTMHADGTKPAHIARQLGIAWSSVYRMLAEDDAARALHRPAEEAYEALHTGGARRPRRGQPLGWEAKFAPANQMPNLATCSLSRFKSCSLPFQVAKLATPPHRRLIGLSLPGASFALAHSRGKETKSR